MTDRPSTTEVAEQDIEARWRAQIAKELRGQTLEMLVGQSEDGIDVHPLYVDQDLEQLDCLDSHPGRGLNARGFEGTVDGGWRNCPEVPLEDPAKLAETVIEEAALGADMAWCRCVPFGASRAGRGSGRIRGWPLHALASSLARIADAKIPVIVETGAVASPIAAAMEQHGGEFSGVSLTIDMFSDRASRGVPAASRELIDEELCACLSWAKDREQGSLRLLCATQPFHDAGASAAQELGIALSLVVGTMRRVEEAGADFEQVLNSLLLRVSIGRDLFTEIAKLRALRSLWSQVMGACGFGTMHHCVDIAAKGSWRDRTKIDPWMNLLRGTTETFAAVAGGATMITTVPMYEALTGESVSARRLAINTQVLLRRESHLGRVIDVGGGSYYIESLTNSLALEGWKWFQKIEASGGVAEALRTKVMHSWLEERSASRNAEVARRTCAIVGVSDFPAAASDPLPDYRESSLFRRGSSTNHVIPRWSRNRPIIARASVLEDATLGNAWDALGESAAMESVGVPLPRARLSESFEALRAQAGRMPRLIDVVLVRVGSGATAHGRADFAVHVFAILGLVVTHCSLDEFQNASATGGGPDVVVLCADDEVLDGRISELVSAVRTARAPKVVVAAPPRPVGGEGPDEFLFRGTDIHAFLQWLLGAVATKFGAVAR